MQIYRLERARNFPVQGDLSGSCYLFKYFIAAHLMYDDFPIFLSISKLSDRLLLTCCAALYFYFLERIRLES